jgi:hypothetical protein
LQKLSAKAALLSIYAESLQPASSPHPVSNEPSFEIIANLLFMRGNTMVSTSSSPTTTPQLESQPEVERRELKHGEILNGRMGADEEVRVWWNPGE